LKTGNLPYKKSMPAEFRTVMMLAQKTATIHERAFFDGKG
jgi:hypothetical protein